MSRTQHDARIAQIEELLVRGAKMLVSNQEANREVDRRIRALVEAQFKTEQALSELGLKLQVLLDSLGKSGNGH